MTVSEMTDACIFIIENGGRKAVEQRLAELRAKIAKGEFEDPVSKRTNEMIRSLSLSRRRELGLDGKSLDYLDQIKACMDALRITDDGNDEPAFSIADFINGQKKKRARKSGKNRKKK
jgi:hypothetical protein